MPLKYTHTQPYSYQMEFSLVLADLLDGVLGRVDPRLLVVSSSPLDWDRTGNVGLPLLHCEVPGASPITVEMRL